MAIYKTEIVERKQIAEGTTEITIRQPRNFSFEAGQYIQLRIPKLIHSDNLGPSRVMSIASSPTNRENITIAFRDTDSGFKKTINELKIGESLLIEGPHGFFTLPEKSNKQFVLIAGGIGITPYLSMIRYATRERLSFPLTLLYANNSKKHAAYINELWAMDSDNENFVLKSKSGRIDKKFINENIKEIDKCIWHIAGPPQMVNTVRDDLLQLKVGSTKIFSEVFTGYK